VHCVFDGLLFSGPGNVGFCEEDLHRLKPKWLVEPDEQGHVLLVVVKDGIRLLELFDKVVVCLDRDNQQVKALSDS
jgi:hypothetical protein